MSYKDPSPMLSLNMSTYTDIFPAAAGRVCSRGRENGRDNIALLPGLG